MINLNLLGWLIPIATELRLNLQSDLKIKDTNWCPKESTQLFTLEIKTYDSVIKSD